MFFRKTKKIKELKERLYRLRKSNDEKQDMLFKEIWLTKGKTKELARKLGICNVPCDGSITGTLLDKIDEKIDTLLAFEKDARELYDGPDTMDIYAVRGHRIIVTELTVNNGSESDRKDLKMLEIGKVYRVDHTEVGGWSTKVFLEGYPGYSFNSVCFQDVYKQTESERELHADYR